MPNEDRYIAALRKQCRAERDKMVRESEDKAKARLAKGWNPVLVKVTQGGGEWEVSLRIVTPDGSPVGGLKVSLEKP